MRIAFEEESVEGHPDMQVGTKERTQTRAYYHIDDRNPLAVELCKAQPCPISFTNMPNTFLLQELDGVVTASWLVTNTDLEAAKSIAERIDAAIAEAMKDYYLVMTYLQIGKKLEVTDEKR